MNECYFQYFRKDLPASSQISLCKPNRNTELSPLDPTTGGIRLQAHCSLITDARIYLWSVGNNLLEDVSPQVLVIRDRFEPALHEGSIDLHRLHAAVG